MGNKGSKNKSPEKKVKEKKAKRTLTVLTVGISGSGKSTFAKQMKILYCGGFNTEEKQTYKDILLKNIVIGMQELVKHAKKLELEELEANRKHARFFQELNIIDTVWAPEYSEKLLALWKDPSVQQAWSQASEYQMQMSSLDYYMEQLDKFTSPDFVPSNEDMLRARQRTTGTSPTTFTVAKTEWRVIDCGGQKPERAKWEAIMEDNTINALIFFAALDEFNMSSVEEQGKTKMQVAMECFREVITSDKVKNMSIVLFLNKKDLFEKKMATKKDFDSFQKTFPKYSGGKDAQLAAEYVGTQFKAIMTKEERKEELYIHTTCALDTEAMDAVFVSVQESLFMNSMMGSVKM